MKHIRNFQSYQKIKKKEDLIRESVLEVNDIYKVKSMIDIPQSLINAYVKKVKDTTGKNLRQFFGDVDIAEEIVKYINTNFLNIDKIPGGALLGIPQAQPQAQAQAQPQAQAQAQDQTQVQTQTESQPQAQAQDEAQPKSQAQVQSKSQAQEEDFEEVQEEEESQGESQESQEESQEESQGESQESEEESQGGKEELPL